MPNINIIIPVFMITKMFLLIIFFFERALAAATLGEIKGESTPTAANSSTVTSAINVRASTIVVDAAAKKSYYAITFPSSTSVGTNFIRLHGKDGTLLAESSRLNTTYVTLMVKDPLKLLAAERQGAINSEVIEIQKTGSQLVLNRVQNGTTFANFADICIDEPNTVYAICRSNVYAYKISMFANELVNRTLASAPLLLPTILFTFYKDFLLSVSQGDLMLLSRDNFATRGSYVFTMRVSVCSLDNLNDNKYLFTQNLTAYGLYKLSLNFDNTSIPSTLSTSLIGQLAVIGAIPTPTISSIYNFGTYQYVMTMVVTLANMPLLLIDKLTWAQYIPITFPTSISLLPGSLTNFIFDGPKSYFSLVNTAANNNFQTYYFMFDKNCTYRAQNLTCTQCVDGFWPLAATANNSCFDALAPPPRIGRRPAKPILEICAVSNCVNCIDNYLNCTECDTANGYILVNGSCVYIAHRCTLTPSVYSNEGVDLSFTALLKDSVTDEKIMTDEVLSQLNTTISWIVTVVGSDPKIVKPATAECIVAKSNPLVYQVNLPSDMNDASYVITAVPQPKSAVINIDDVNYQVEVSALYATYIPTGTSEGIKSAEKVGQGMSYLSDLGATNSTYTISMSTGLLALDPTGTFFRFTKILQIVNKLYFININYGKRLDAFLGKMRKVSRDTDEKQAGELRAYNTLNWRGKLSKDKMLLAFADENVVLITLYLISWILKGVKRLLLDNCIMGKIGIYFCHYANKAHLIIFNLVFIDFIWLAPRTLLHGQKLGHVRINIALVCLVLLVADLCLILSHLLDDRIWRKALEQSWYKMAYVKAGPKGNEVAYAKKTGSAEDERSHQDPTELDTQQINYKKTYFEIDFNVHLMDMATNTLRVDESVFQSTLCRLLTAHVWFRVPLMSLTIFSCQYANTLGLTVLLIIELSRLFATIYAYLKYKYLKNIICLLMEVAPSIFLPLFFLNALLISPKRFDELIMDFYQDAGIWIVIASCVAEYLLLLTYIGVATYDFFKNRKMMRRKQLKQRGAMPLITYVGEKYYDEKADEEVFYPGGAKYPYNHQNSSNESLVDHVQAYPRNAGRLGKPRVDPIRDRSADDHQEELDQYGRSVEVGMFDMYSRGYPMANQMGPPSSQIKPNPGNPRAQDLPRNDYPWSDEIPLSSSNFRDFRPPMIQTVGLTPVNTKNGNTTGQAQHREQLQPPLPNNAVQSHFVPQSYVDLKQPIQKLGNSQMRNVSPVMKPQAVNSYESPIQARIQVQPPGRAPMSTYQKSVDKNQAYTNSGVSTNRNLQDAHGPSNDFYIPQEDVMNNWHEPKTKEIVASSVKPLIESVSDSKIDPKTSYQAPSPIRHVMDAPPPPPQLKQLPAAPAFKLAASKIVVNDPKSRSIALSDMSGPASPSNLNSNEKPLQAQQNSNPPGPKAILNPGPYAPSPLKPKTPVLPGLRTIVTGIQTGLAPNVQPNVPQTAPHSMMPIQNMPSAFNFTKPPPMEGAITLPQKPLNSSSLVSDKSVDDSSKKVFSSLYGLSNASPVIHKLNQSPTDSRVPADKYSSPDPASIKVASALLPGRDLQPDPNQSKLSPEQAEALAPFKMPLKVAVMRVPQNFPRREHRDF